MKCDNCKNRWTEACKDCIAWQCYQPINEEPKTKPIENGHRVYSISWGNCKVEPHIEGDELLIPTMFPNGGTGTLLKQVIITKELFQQMIHEWGN